MKSLVVFLTSLLIALSATGAEEDKRSPVDRYRGDGQFAMFMCKTNFKMAQAKAQLGKEQDGESDYRGCIKQGKATAKVNLDAAVKTTKKPKAQEALKTYHVALITALEGIVPGADERKISYEQRQQALQEKMTETWARFEVEQ